MSNFIFNKDLALAKFVFDKIKAKDYTLTYEEAINLSKEMDIKYVWSKDNEGNPYLRGIIFLKFEGLIWEVTHENN